MGGQTTRLSARVSRIECAAEPPYRDWPDEQLDEAIERKAAELQTLLSAEEFAEFERDAAQKFSAFKVEASK